ncbi:DUF1848 domain-containing protein [Sulfurospirillum sp.]|uniref:DUF1848 domain-containing protein n=1 Tax=Sulfurospirillum sp. TaxID=2053622 RepID=UPI002FDE0FB1
MIINTGTKTDIPAFFSQWFYRRIEEGFVYVRNTYNPSLVKKYLLHPHSVDCLTFCTKNPAPMLPKLHQLEPFGQFWFVSITPYGKEIEPYVPSVHDVIASFQSLSKSLGSHKVIWRYDPIFINDVYTVEHHIKRFDAIASSLAGYTHTCVISFIDLYAKHISSGLAISMVHKNERIQLAQAFFKIAQKYDMSLKTCVEGKELTLYGVDCSGCMTQSVIEKAIGQAMSIPKKSTSRKGCSCVLENDIGMYNSCLHGCVYCYANTSLNAVRNNVKLHNPASPLLLGELLPTDTLQEVSQMSYKSRQARLFD